ncbi:MAG: hypothetical protein ACTSP1_10555, partial [Candidatus Freyarchaeota archaeon]
ELTSEIKNFLLEQGADIVGVAPVSRFAGCPEETHPQHYMPDATCVISFGMKIMDGVCDVWGEYNEPHKSIAPYLFYGYGLLNFDMSRIGNLAAKRLLEFRGYKALMFPPTWNISQYRFIEKVLEPYVSFLADFSHRHAAVAAGLGEFGFSGLVLVPKYGARVRFNSIITNAPLVPDPMYDGPKLCQPEKCNYKCVRDCPTGALTLDETFKVKIGDKEYEYTKAEKVRCLMGVNAMVSGTGARTRRKHHQGKKRKSQSKTLLRDAGRSEPSTKYFSETRGESSAETTAAGAFTAAQHTNGLQNKPSQHSSILFFQISGTRLVSPSVRVKPLPPVFPVTRVPPLALLRGASKFRSRHFKFLQFVGSNLCFNSFNSQVDVWGRKPRNS